MVNINCLYLLWDMFLLKLLYNMNVVCDYKKKYVFEVGFVLWYRIIKLLNCVYCCY